MIDPDSNFLFKGNLSTRRPQLTMGHFSFVEEMALHILFLTSFILFIHHDIHIYFEFCTYCKIGDIYLL